MRLPGFEIVAHRGARVLDADAEMAPANTMPAFLAAARQGASIELDVFATRDGRLAVYHDGITGKIFSLPQGEKLLTDATADDLVRARLNTMGHEAEVAAMRGPSAAPYRTPPAWRDVRIPELGEVLAALPETHVYIELKTGDDQVRHDRNNRLEERVVRLIQAQRAHERVTVISFSPESLRKVKKLDPAIRTGLDVKLSATPAQWRKRPWHHRLGTQAFLSWARHWVGVSSLHPAYDDMSETLGPKLVAGAHRRRMRIVPWVSGQTVDEETALAPRLKAMGVDGLITNAVAHLQRVL